MKWNPATRLRALGLASLLAGSLVAGAAQAADGVVKVGVIQALAGDCAQWGIPVVRGTQMWADELNAQGGILAGDGKRYTIEIRPYDNVCYIPGEELKAARRAILDDGVQYLLQTYTPASRQAIADLLNEKKVLAISYGAGFLSEKYPYLMGGITGTSRPICMSSAISSRSIRS